NLAYGDGSLVVATADRLHVLVAPATEAAGPLHRVGQVTDEGPDRRHCRLLWQADALRRAGRPAAEVGEILSAAAGSEFSPARRCLAMVRAFENADDAKTQFQIVRGVTQSDDLWYVSVRGADGRIWTASKWVADDLNGVVDAVPTQATVEPVADEPR